MHATAKLFTTGRSQALRLPKEFRFPGAEVFIRRDPVTGEVILSPKPVSWTEFSSLPIAQRFLPISWRIAKTCRAKRGICFDALYAGYKYGQLYYQKPSPGDS